MARLILLFKYVFGLGRWRVRYQHGGVSGPHSLSDANTLAEIFDGEVEEVK